MQRPEFQQPHGLSLSFSLLRNGLHLTYQIFSSLWWRDLSGSVKDVDAMVGQQINEVKAELNGLPAGKSQIQAMIQILNSLLFVVLEVGATVRSG